MTTQAPVQKFTLDDYKTGLNPVWCPGCGDYGVLSALHRALTILQLEPWNVMILSGIGCSSRLVGYVDCYGFNGVHGRALPLATGVKVARPDLTVIAAGGDGDGLAIGGNHLIHTARRNLDITYIMMDNQIYGLTKGQVAPTTPTGDKTKSTYWGNPDPSVDPCEAAIGVGATWVGRGFSGEARFLTELMCRAIKHRGFSFLNVLSPCVTWRGEQQFKVMKEKLHKLPKDHNVSRRRHAIPYTRERDVITTGVLYEVYRPSLADQLDSQTSRAWCQEGEPTVEKILEGFRPDF